MQETDLSLYDNQWYRKQIGASRIKQSLWYLINGAFFINPLNPFSGLKCFLLRVFGGEIGRHVVIKPGVNIKYPWKLKIADHVWIGEKVWIDNLACVKIGKNVVVSQGALLLTGNHDYKKKSFDLIVHDITIEDGAWIGAKCIVCPGVNVATHTVITAGAVLTQNTKPYAVYSGNPATFLRQRLIK